MAANSSAAHAASADDDLGLGDALAGFSREQLGQFVGALTKPTDERSKILLEAVADGTMAAALQVAAAQAAMPADAEERWGHAVAGHRCAGRDGNCFAKLARDNAAPLDTLRSSLVQAKERAAEMRRCIVWLVGGVLYTCFCPAPSFRAISLPVPAGRGGRRARSWRARGARRSYREEFILAAGGRPHPPSPLRGPVCDLHYTGDTPSHRCVCDDK